MNDRPRRTWDIFVSLSSAKRSFKSQSAKSPLIAYGDRRDRVFSISDLSGTEPLVFLLMQLVVITLLSCAFRVIRLRALVVWLALGLL